MPKNAEWMEEQWREMREGSKPAKILRRCLESSSLQLTEDALNVADKLEYNVKSYDLDGESGSDIVAADSTLLPEPKSVVCTTGGHCYISDYNSIKVVKLGGNGTLSPANIRVKRPTGMNL